LLHILWKATVLRRTPCPELLVAPLPLQSFINSNHIAFRSYLSWGLAETPRLSTVEPGDFQVRVSPAAFTTRICTFGQAYRIWVQLSGLPRTKPSVSNLYKIVLASLPFCFSPPLTPCVVFRFSGPTCGIFLPTNRSGWPPSTKSEGLRNPQILTRMVMERNMAPTMSTSPAVRSLRRTRLATTSIVD
jgi:hypothetical protein